MAEPKDPAIKLFGKTIPLQDTPYGDDNADDEDDDSNKLLNQQPLFPPTISENNLILNYKENDIVRWFQSFVYFNFSLFLINVVD